MDRRLNFSKTNLNVEPCLDAITSAAYKKCKMMSDYIYNYEEWLSGHANRKTMMQKLERSLIPYEIFEAIGLQNDKQERSGEVCLDGNTVGYDSGNTRIVSARSYMMRLPMKTMERRLVEKLMLTLMSQIGRASCRERV